MQKVYLNGSIADKFGSFYEVNCRSVKDIFKLFSCQLDGFRQYMVDAAEAGVGFEIIKGSKVLTEENHLLLGLEDEDIIITEIPAGAKGAVKIILAIVIIVVAFYTGPAGWGAAGSFMAQGGAVGFGAQLAVSLAVSLAISGITELLMSPPEVDGTDYANESDGYLFNGPTNNIKYGQAIPIAYGELRIGGAPISSYYQGSPIA